MSESKSIKMINVLRCEFLCQPPGGTITSPKLFCVILFRMFKICKCDNCEDKANASLAEIGVQQKVRAPRDVIKHLTQAERRYPLMDELALPY